MSLHIWSLHFQQCYDINYLYLHQTLILPHIVSPILDLMEIQVAITILQLTWTFFNIPCNYSCNSLCNIWFKIEQYDCKYYMCSLTIHYIGLICSGVQYSLVSLVQCWKIWFTYIVDVGQSFASEKSDAYMYFMTSCWTILCVIAKSCILYNITMNACKW